MKYSINNNKFAYRNSLIETIIYKETILRSERGPILASLWKKVADFLHYMVLRLWRWRKFYFNLYSGNSIYVLMWKCTGIIGFGPKYRLWFVCFDSWFYQTHIIQQNKSYSANSATTKYKRRKQQKIYKCNRRYETISQIFDNDIFRSVCNKFGIS